MANREMLDRLPYARPPKGEIQFQMETGHLDSFGGMRFRIELRKSFRHFFSQYHVYSFIEHDRRWTERTYSRSYQVKKALDVASEILSTFVDLEGWARFEVFTQDF